ncbi:tectonic-like complex member MKS1 isoform X2 [Oratosquilla oratoria]|uniref:tectonic-like complex member MKS1 isoform X2 n=1 Tax=Oratosquilla oratoria TaxID=337810 RepID=UPI003F760419
MEYVKDEKAYYYTKDQIENLRIRVVLQKLTGSQLVDVSPRVFPEAGTSLETAEGIPLSTLPTLKGKGKNKSDFEQVVISWQQKLFSKAEREEYKKGKYAKDTRYKAYHEMLTKEKRGRKKLQRLFTYTQDDNFHVLQSSKPSTTSYSYSLRFRGSQTGKSDDDVMERVGKQEENESSGSHSSTMYIMADLSSQEGDGTSGDEVLLCSLNYDSRGLLTVSPPFTQAKPYRIEQHGASNVMYEYTLENISTARTIEEKLQDESLKNQMLMQRIEQLNQTIGDEFETCEKGMYRLVIHGEISRALYFKASSIYIQYILHLPHGWTANEGTDCNGTTPTCSTVYVDNTEVTVFSTPFSVDVSCNLSNIGQKVVVEGEDERSDNVFHVGTWQPVQCTPVDKLRRHFIGGCRLIEDSSYLTPNFNTEKKRINRYGFQTKSSGTIEVHAHALAQTCPQMPTDDFTIGYHLSAMQMSTQAVIEAFHRSQQKLRAAKQGLKR